MDQDLKEKTHQACRTAEEFIKLFYDVMDNKRHLISRYILDTGVLVWNGTGIAGKDDIQKFLLSLPTSEHIITSLDSHPILDTAVGGQLTLLIQVSGSVRRQGKAAPIPFQQNFMITAQGDKWKIVTDCYRDQIPVDFVQ